MNMKYILGLCIVVSFLGCKKIDKLTQFNMNFDQTAVIPASSSINLPFNILTPEMETNSASTFEIHDTRKDLIEEIKLTTLALTLTSPSNTDFSFLKSISLYISADGLPETKIAWRDDIPQDVSVLNLTVANTDIKEYIKKDNFSLRLNTVTDEVLTQDHEIAIHSLLFVDAKILGQ